MEAAQDPKRFSNPYVHLYFYRNGSNDCAAPETLRIKKKEIHTKIEKIGRFICYNGMMLYTTKGRFVEQFRDILNHEVFVLATCYERFMERKYDQRYENYCKGLASNSCLSDCPDEYQRHKRIRPPSVLVSQRESRVASRDKKRQQTKIKNQSGPCFWLPCLKTFQNKRLPTPKLTQTPSRIVTYTEVVQPKPPQVAASKKLDNEKKQETSKILKKGVKAKTTQTNESDFVEKPSKKDAKEQEKLLAKKKKMEEKLRIQEEKAYKKVLMEKLKKKSKIDQVTTKN